jgi:Holliday junction resolvasome RuvABC endonuclease subunit
MSESDAVTLFLGVDPGASGAFAVVTANGQCEGWIKSKETEHDVATWLRERAMRIRAGLLEQVHSMPKQGVASSFKFGMSYGFCRGILVASGVAFETITPLKWQQAMRCCTGGDKNVSKAAAQRLWPTEKITHANADALLIAELCRRKWSLHNNNNGMSSGLVNQNSD